MYTLIKSKEQPTDKNQPETGENMKTVVQSIIASLVLWMETLGTREKAVEKARCEITATVKEWNEAFQLIGWHEWKKTVTAEQAKEILPATVPPAPTEPAPNTPALIEHTTRKGKVIRGIIRADITKEDAKEIDEYTFAKNGGWFIREKYLVDISPVNKCQANETPADVSPVEIAPVEIEPQGYEKNGVWYGGRYDSALSTTDICKKIRQHLKEEQAKNPLFTFSKFSVRKEHHKSIVVRVVEMGFNPLNPERVDMETDRKCNSYGMPYYTPDGKAFFDRIKAIVDSYNFDGSDTQTDYFHVNFYSDVNLDYEASKTFRAEIEEDLENKVREYRQALRDSWPACTQCGKKTEHAYSTEGGEHAGLCFDCWFPYDQEEKARRQEEYRREREETARQMATIADVQLSPVEVFIDVLLPSLNKNNTLDEYTEQRENGNFQIVRGKITERAELTTEQYDVLTNNLLHGVPWLAGKGGCDSTADLPGTDDLSFFQLSPEQQEEWKRHVYTLFIEVTAPDRETIYIDPQGHDYARYLGFAAGPDHKDYLFPGDEVIATRMPEGSVYEQVIGTVDEVKKNGWVRINATRVKDVWSGEWKDHPTSCNCGAEACNVERLETFNQVAVTPSPAKASTDCSPVNRWNNHAPAMIPGQGAVKVAPVEKPAPGENDRALWQVQSRPTEKRSKTPCVEILPPARPDALTVPLPSNTGHQAQRSEAKKEAVTLAPVPANKAATRPEKKPRPVPVQNLPEKDEAFYPTPDGLAIDMMLKIKGNPRTILDPSAGKGDLLAKIKDSYNHRSAALYAIEIDNNLRSILQGKGHTVIDSDFLAWSGPDKFDCIVMNPPFNRGAEHLLKAIDTMYSGQIVCLLNAETLLNPCTNTRKELARRLEELGAEIEYRNRQFMQAERRTPVDVALVNIIIERKVEDDLFEGASDTAEACNETVEDRHEVSTGKRIEELVARYNEVVRLTVETIVNFYRNHNTVGRYIGLNREPSGHWSPQKGYELTVKVQETVNSTVRTIRTDYWRMTLDLPEVKDRMTQKRRSEFEEKLRQNEHMDFTERNIRQFLINLIDGYTKTLEEGVLEVFDRLTIRNSYHEELHTKNIHYFNGWKTNNAYRVGQRVIVPVGGGYDGPFSSWGGKWKLDWTAARSLDDIDLVLSYFNGGREHVKLSSAIQEAFERGEQSGRSTFFQFKAHKKGTLHLTFLDENILRRFNVAACRGKEWLPGDYGQKPFKDMSPAEKATVQSFEAGGVEAYNANVGRALFDATINTIQLLEAA